MQETILIIYLIVSIALIGIILLQQGKGAEMGASFGAGGANTVFGAAGSGNVLTKTTTILAILFFAIALSISYFNAEPVDNSDAILDEAPTQQAPAAPSLEAEVPVSESGGLEAEVPPTQEAEATTPVETATPAETKEAAEDDQKPASTESKKTESDNN